MSPRTGRPRKGETRVEDLERVTIRLQPETRECLRQLAARLELAEYEVVERAIIEFSKGAGGRRRRR